LTGGTDTNVDYDALSIATCVSLQEQQATVMAVTAQIDTEEGLLIHLLRGFLGPHDSASQTAFRLVQSFLRGSFVCDQHIETQSAQCEDMHRNSLQLELLALRRCRIKSTAVSIAATQYSNVNIHARMKYNPHLETLQ